MNTMDRISQCPNGVLVSVISGMKARELLRTRVLSRHWLEVWKSVPTLIFDLEEFTGDDNRRFNDQEYKEGITKFGNLVQYFINNRDHSVDTSEIVLKYDVLAYDGPINLNQMTELVINYCMNHQPKTFYMDITTGICSINIPDSFFNCKSIEEVRFFVLDKNVDYKFRPSTVDMPNLRKIHFKCISFDDSKMKEFLSGTANLKILTLEYCTLEMEFFF